MILVQSIAVPPLYGHVFRFFPGLYRAVMENRFPMRNRAAPGYRMYIIWAIRHLPGDPWRRGANLPEYQWLERQP